VKKAVNSDGPKNILIIICLLTDDVHAPTTHGLFILYFAFYRAGPKHASAKKAAGIATKSKWNEKQAYILSILSSIQK
jgi:hypothetical protein